jgi:hypothetical protein
MFGVALRRLVLACARVHSSKIIEGLQHLDAATAAPLAGRRVLTGTPSADPAMRGSAADVGCGRLCPLTPRRSAVASWMGGGEASCCDDARKSAPRGGGAA